MIIVAIEHVQITGKQFYYMLIKCRFILIAFKTILRNCILKLQIFLSATYFNKKISIIPITQIFQVIFLNVILRHFIQKYTIFFTLYGIYYKRKLISTITSDNKYYESKIQVFKIAKLPVRIKIFPFLFSFQPLP